MEGHKAKKASFVKLIQETKTIKVQTKVITMKAITTKGITAKTITAKGQCREINIQRKTQIEESEVKP